MYYNLKKMDGHFLPQHLFLLSPPDLCILEDLLPKFTETQTKRQILAGFRGLTG